VPTRLRTIDDNELLAALKTGDDKAFDQIFRIYYASLSFYAFQLTANKELAEDIVQESFMRLWRFREKLSQAENLKSYLYRTVHNCHINWSDKLRHEKSRVDIGYAVDRPDPDLMIRSETIREVHRVILLLPPRMREVFKLYYLEGWTAEEISRLLNRSIHTITSQRKRALQLFREQFIPG
jgi:RNA polymerase sigma-70 factor (ECF subfamily)